MEEHWKTSEISKKEEKKPKNWVKPNKKQMKQWSTKDLKGALVSSGGHLWETSHLFLNLS